MSKRSATLLLIFVKHPVPGQTKTRLAASIGHEKALSIYRELLAYTLKVAQSTPYDKAVFYGNDLPEVDLWSEAGYPRFAQEGEDLGTRMQWAFEWGFAEGYSSVIIIGSDCPAITLDHLLEAKLVLSSKDFVMGPATDGGYYLLGMNTLFPPVFQHKSWSTDTVFTDTLKDLEAANLHVGLLPELSDVDTVEDLVGTFLEGAY